MAVTGGDMCAAGGFGAGGLAWRAREGRPARPVDVLYYVVLYADRPCSAGRAVCGVAARPSLCPFARGAADMVMITFPDRDTEKRALGFLLGRFSGRALRTGEHLVPEAALEALADQNIPFSVKGKATYEQQVAAVRGSAPVSLQ